MKTPPEEQYAQNPSSGSVGLLPLMVLLASTSTFGGALSVVRDGNLTTLPFILQTIAGVVIAVAYGVTVANLFRTRPYDRLGCDS
jgi:hypothetical protein